MLDLNPPRGAAQGWARDFDWCEGPRDGATVAPASTPEQIRGECVDGPPVCVAVVGSRTEGELIVGLLRSHGLRADMATDDAGGQYPQLQLEGVRVLVAPSDEAAARRLLASTAESTGPVSSRTDLTGR